MTSETHRTHGSGANPYHISIDDRGIVTADSWGFWTLHDTERFLDELRPFLRQSRMLLGAARIYSDIGKMAVQSRDVALRLGRAEIEELSPTDRRALVVQSALIKLQLKRVITHPGTRVFTSPPAAWSWLRDDRGPLDQPR